MRYCIIVYVFFLAFSHFATLYLWILSYIKFWKFSIFIRFAESSISNCTRFVKLGNINALRFILILTHVKPRFIMFLFELSMSTGYLTCRKNYIRIHNYFRKLFKFVLEFRLNIKLQNWLRSGIKVMETCRESAWNMRFSWWISMCFHKF